jgi:hypothetical protein
LAIHTFEQSSVDSIVQFQDLVSHMRTAIPMVVPTDAVNVKVAPDGGTMTFTLDPDLIEDVLEALDARQYSFGLADFDTSSLEVSEALRKHMQKRREERRIDYSKKVDEDLRREARNRRPVGHLVGDCSF